MTTSIQPIYLSHAQLFTYDQDGDSRAWVPVHTQPVPTSIMFDATRGLYRLISVDPGCKQVIANSTIVEHLEFHKTSQRFGHWRDQATGAVYGIGFKTEQQLEDFADCIRKAKAAFSSTTSSSSTSTNKKMSKKNSLAPLLPNNNNPEHLKLRELMSRLGLDTEPVKHVGEQFMELEVILPPREAVPSTQQEKQNVLSSLMASQEQYMAWKGELEGLRVKSEELTRALESLEGEIEDKKRLLVEMCEREQQQQVEMMGGDPRETGQGDGGCAELEKHYKSLLESANRMFSEAVRPVGGGGGGGAADALFCRAIHELTGLHGEVVRGRRTCGGGGGDGGEQD